MPRLAVIFDMDGVLVDSYRAHFASWQAMFGEQGREYGEAAFAADFGRTSRDILNRMFGGELSDATIREMDERKESLYRDIIRRDFPVMSGAGELVDALAAAGFLLAVGSSGPAENIALSLDRLGRGKQFSAVVTGADVTRGKPDPQVFQLAAQRLDVAPGSCCVVEDAPHGIEAANRAGMKSIALTGTTTREKLAHANLVVDDLRAVTPECIRALLV